MPVPPLPPPLVQLGRRPFSFYPAILNLTHNEWIYQSATWSEVLVRNTRTNEEIFVPRRYLGEISLDAPVVIVGLLAELEYRAGAVCPAERRVIEMPRAVNDSPLPRPHTPAARAEVVGIRLESDSGSRMGKLVLAGVALGVAGCVLAISLYRGGLIASRVFYAPVLRADLPLTPQDGYAAVVRLLGPPAGERWRPGPAPAQYQWLAYPRRGLYIILTGPTRSQARYIGALDWNWRPVHTVELPGHATSYALLKSLPRF